ncbi:esterase-like activity of phytase family protein [Paracoccus sp. MC1862]|uniref:esterase-like activity of phytase family protein n=1 Tax=Paracoccus sp. MC1862 TaxID=2760307 RepID=UPI001603F5EC|nr:esterase-like activity of phytase family protein [Paracoccus sp. MC1862]MBB1496899.1 esterase-like activity of phytase family protein [Paracoccus sp. MC1862]QQO46311.1 esterase-like activity of phytase family protein [Paracoccus sp. MC1862]
MSVLIRSMLTSALALLAAAPALAEPHFNRIASFATVDNMAEGEDPARETSAEIMAVTPDGSMLIYSDSPLGALGMVDITDPRQPKPLGNVPMDGEPTTAVVRGTLAFVGVNTSDSFTDPSGVLRTLDLSSGQVIAGCDLGGQPDAVAISPAGDMIAVAIENERDEEVNDGALPQMPAGFVLRLPVTDAGVDCAGLQRIDLTGLADVVPEDPEPEYLSFNEAGELAVTLQENNHLVVIGADGQVAAHFSAGAVDLDGIDTEDDGRLDFTGAQRQVPREPDAVVWLDDDHFATANEGDWKGGSRGFTIWSKDGSVVHESGTAFERALIAIGHYPDGRSDNKGVEPEGMAFAAYGDQRLLFVGSERGSVVGVYDVADPADPRLLQLLPSGIGPEGLTPIPARNLFATANETDLGEDGGARSHVMIYERTEGPAAYPTLTSEGSEPLIGWGAISGLAVDPADDTRLFAVSDSAYSAEPAIYTIDAAATPARITAKTIVTRDGQPAEKLDLEGITSDGHGGFWLASEGDAGKDVPHAVLRVDASGAITDEIGLPAALDPHQTRFGFEGIALVEDKLWLAVQREWGDDPDGQTKLLQLDPATQDWAAVRYPLDSGEGWVGLSEIARHGDHLYVIERDNLIGQAARLKAITRIPLADLNPASLGGELPLVTKEPVRDLIPDLLGWGGFVQDKVESLAIASDGTAWIATDNDGVEDASGETFIWSVRLD